MKTFKAWLVEHHPEHVDEGVGETIRKGVVTAALLATPFAAWSGAKYGAADKRPAVSKRIEDKRSTIDDESARKFIGQDSKGQKVHKDSEL